MSTLPFPQSARPNFLSVSLYCSFLMFFHFIFREHGFSVKLCRESPQKQRHKNVQGETSCLCPPQQGFNNILKHNRHPGKASKYASEMLQKKEYIVCLVLLCLLFLIVHWEFCQLHLKTNYSTDWFLRSRMHLIIYFF